ncbi:MAG: glycogen/starch synthase [Muribaculaceae bacterium]|jgi:starch synthase|nr:glycogen/starch synthase [Muribaculaceae bacterium]
MNLEKVLFINQAVSPYLTSSVLADTGRSLPEGIQEKGLEVRVFMPKYGFVNERRNQLHEVIRLSGMNLIIDDTDHPLIIKVATLQSARMQVYFIYNEDYFQHNVTKELETATSPADNDERSIFFARGVMETVKKLRWEPDIIHCNGWLTALAPIYNKYIFHEDPTFNHAKMIYSIYDDSFSMPFNARFYDKMRMDGILAKALRNVKGKELSINEVNKLAVANSDAVIQECKELNPDVAKFIEKSGIPFLPYKEGGFSTDDYLNFYKSL